MFTRPQAQPNSARRGRASAETSTFDWKMMGYVTIGAVAFLVISVWYGRSWSTEAIFRAHFHIPPGVEFTRSEAPTRGTARQIEAFIEFSEAEYAAYLATLNDPAVWKPQRTAVNRIIAEPPFSPRALRWENGPYRGFVGSKWSGPTWGNLSRERVQKASRGLAFCLALRFPPGERQTDRVRPIRKEFEHHFPRDTPADLEAYNSVHCAELGRSERARGYLLGFLDDDTRTLHMIAR
ncbi:MAG: hypothetical protein ACFCUN_10520 [Hyphomicrobiaceae bacterium]